ncbi:MAG: hypothetical protein ACLP8A_00410 [Methylovirgula sp.]
MKQRTKTQASLWAYIDVFVSLMLIGLAISMRATTLHKTKSGGAEAAA